MFLLAKNGVHIGDNPDALTYSKSDPVFDATVNKNLHATIVYDYNDGNQHYRITYRMKDIIERMNVSNVTSGGAGKVTGAMKLAFKLFGNKKQGSLNWKVEAFFCVIIARQEKI